MVEFDEDDDRPEFKWPCDLRRAHGPHKINDAAWAKVLRDCPGVMAHPATMIGGNYVSQRPR